MNINMDDENKNIPLKMYFTTNEIKNDPKPQALVNGRCAAKSKE